MTFCGGALLGGLGVAAVAGPLGCFVVWRRMAYFGATLSHAALLGIAVGLFLELDLHIGIFIVCIAVSGALMLLGRRPELTTDTVLGILAHSSLAFGLVVLSFQDQVRVDLLAYLFGDVLSVRASDLMWIWGGGAVCLLVTGVLWRPLLSITVDEDLARVEGVPVERMRFAFLLLLSAVVALSMQVVGLLLTVSLLVIPAATARRFALSPESMAGWAVVVGGVAVAAGLQASLSLDTPAGPSIVVVASLLFVVSGLIRVRA